MGRSRCVGQRDALHLECIGWYFIVAILFVLTETGFVCLFVFIICFSRDSSEHQQWSQDPCFPLWCLPRICTPEQPTVR